MADGIFYNDLREPFCSTDGAIITLATTNKALYTPSAHPVLGGQYWARPGKGMRIRLFGRMTTGITPGNGQFAVYYGSGADATGTILAASKAIALGAAATNLEWMVEIDIMCRTTGSVGTLFCTGWTSFDSGLIASANAPMLIGGVAGTAPVVSAAVDLTAANIISVQFNRSGSTAETMQYHLMQLIALN